MSAINPRWYQTACVQSYLDFISKNPCGANPCIVMPTGTGKSIVIAMLVKHALQWPENRVLVLTHVGELVRQNAQKLQDIWPEAPIGIYSASLKAKDTHTRVVFGNMQSVCRRLKKEPAAFGVRQLVLIDECHLVSDKDDSQYQTLLKILKQQYPYLRVCGLSATPYRSNGGLLTEQDNAIFTHIAYDLTSKFNQLVQEGYLAPLVSPEVNIVINLEGVHVRQGDYKQDELQRAVNYDVLQKACAYTVASAQNRRSWLVFVNSIANADLVEKLLNSMGVKAIAVHSHKDSESNSAAIRNFRTGSITALISADQLTTGFDVPQVDLIAMLRPTMSTSLHVQMLGRGTRPCNGKVNCLVLDFAHNINRLGPINNPFIKGKKDKLPQKSRDANSEGRTCPFCGAYVQARSRYCTACGEYLPELKIDTDILPVSPIDDVFHGYRPQSGSVLAFVSGMLIEFKKETCTKDSSAYEEYMLLTLMCRYRFNSKSFKTKIMLKFNSMQQASLSGYVWQMFQGRLPAPLSLQGALKRIQELKRPLGIEVKQIDTFDQVTKCFY